MDLARLSALFGAARRLPASERPAYLEGACAGDTALRREVEGLLEAHEAAGTSEQVHPRLASLPAVAAEVVADATRAAERPHSTEDIRVEGFRVVSRLAEGGMGTVYVAEQERPRRLVALKVLRPEAATVDGRRRFEREAEVLARLAHPGIARVLVHGATTGPGAPRPYLVMELVEGRPLTQATAALDVRARVAVLAEVAEAVAHAHAKGVIHRDLKPDNILVQADGRPKVVDFGVARLADDAGTSRTRAGYLIGTLAYMSPEQARGDAAGVDTRSDVYSLGVVAYEVLCGRHPLGDRSGTFTEIARRILEERPPEPAEVDPALRGDLSLILTKALAKDPAERYAGASAFAEDLRRHLADEPILARPPTGTYLVRRFLRRHKALVAGSALAVVLLTTGLVVALKLAHGERQARQHADASTEAMRRALAERNLEIAVLALRERETEAALRALEQVPNDLRAWEWRHLASRLDASESWEPLPPSSPFVAATLGPHGTSWQARRADGSRWVRGPGAEAPTKLEAPTGMALRALTQAGAESVAVYQNRSLFEVVDGAGHRRAGTLPTDRHVQSIAYSPDASRLALAQDGVQSRSPLVVLDATSGAILWQVSGSVMETRALCFSPDGRLLACTGGWDGAVRILDLEARRARTPDLNGHTVATNALAFTPDGATLVTGSEDRSARVWDVESGAERARLLGHQGPILAVAISPAGDRVATAGRDATVRVWSLAGGAPLHVLLGHRGAVHALAFGEDGQSLVSLGDDGRRTWRLDRDQDVLRPHRSVEEGNRHPYVYAARFSPDGTRLASAGWDETVRIVNLATGALARTLKLDGTAVLDVGWCRDGRSVVGVAKEALVRWDVDSGQEVARWKGGRNIASLAVLKDGRGVLSAGMRGTVRVHALPGLEVVASWQAASSIARMDVSEVDVSEGRGHFAILTQAGRVQVHALSDGALRWGAAAHGASEHGEVAFSPDGLLLASGGADRKVRIWNAATGELVRTLEGHPDAIYALAWLPDGTRLFSGDRRGLIRLWDPRDGRACLELRGHEEYVYGFDVAPDGQTVVSASGDNTVRLWTAPAPPEGR